MQKQNSRSGHDPGYASRGWPVDDHVGEVRLDHLLVVVDETALLADEPSHAPLLSRAALIASALNCRLTLYAPCADDALIAALTRMDGTVHDRQALADLAATRIAERARWVESRGVSRVDTQVLWEPLDADVLLGRARELEADLILKSGTSQRFLFGLMTHTDWELLRNAPMPVWFVTPSARVPMIRNVLTALGNSEHPEDVLGAHDYDVCALAKAIAAKTSATHSIVHAYEVPQTIPPFAAYAPEAAALPPDAVPAESDRRRLTAEAHGEALSAFGRLFHIDPDRILLQPGRLSDVIPDVAETTEADVIVMGSRNLSRWQRLLRPVNAEAVLAEAPCDVLILPQVTTDAAADAERPVVEGSPQFDLEAAVLNPEAVFGTPLALIDCAVLSIAFRRRLLEIWESDIRAEMVEEDEGGPVGPPQADRLQQIHDARERLAAVEARPTTSAQPEFS